MTNRILVVDDDDSIRGFLEMALSDEGYEVRGASDGRAALRLADEWPPALILLDLRMGGLSGPGFAEAYRQKPSPRAAILVITAAKDAPAAAAELGADGSLGKPFDLTQLLDLVSRLVGRPQIA